MSDDGADLARPDSGIVGALRPSPNHGARIGPTAPDCIVLHYTGMPDGEGAIRWLCDPASSVSCHYVVMEDGTVLQLVAEDRRAWHAGRAFWAGLTDLNSASIGIEIVNAGHAGGLPPFPAPQVAAVVRLVRDIVDRRGIPADRVLAHSDIAPGRKEDPGERFPWRALFDRGLVLWAPEPLAATGDTLAVGAAGEAVAAWQAGLATFGYGLPVTGVYDEATATVVRAFQRRYRPRLIDGRADAGTRAVLDTLLKARAGTAAGP